ncbi:MAG TPA: secretin N-terminal domain-containing protein, partial [bacterium]|nr:secretin N-terminal domain-containing protein [bacterium]
MKSLRLSFVLLLVFSAITISVFAGSKNGSLSLEIDGNRSVVSESFAKTFFKMGESSLEIIGLGDAHSDFADVKAQKGSVKGDSATLLNLPLNGLSSVVEIDEAGSGTVKLGELEKLVSLGDQKTLKEGTVTMEKNPGSIKFSFTKQPESIRFFSLKGPDRLVFDFIGIKGSIKSAPGVRSANHPSGFRVVIEKDIPQYFTIVRNSGYFFSVEGRNEFASFTAAGEIKTAKTDVKKVDVKVMEKKAEEAVPQADKAEVTGLAFIGEDPEILKIKSSKPLKINKKVEGQKIDITIENAFIAKDKEQVVDASSLNGPVTELAIYNENGNVKVLARMKTADFIISVDESAGGKEFVFQTKKNEPVQAVAGYSEAQIVRVPQSAVGQDGEEAAKAGALRMDDEVVQYTGKKINLDFKEVDILDILRLMADISKLNIIAGDDVKGTVTVRLVDIPWDEALDVILKSKSLGKERFGNIIRVATIRTMQREKEEELAKKNAQKKLEPVKVRLIPVNYAMANKLVTQLKELLTDRGTVSVDERTNVLIIKDVEEVLDKAEQLVEYLDTQTPQVLI